MRLRAIPRRSPWRKLALLLLVFLVAGCMPGQPSGRLAYVKEGQVWVMELPDGAPRQIARDAQYLNPVWSPSGDWLLLQLDGRWEVLHRDGSERLGLTPRRPVWMAPADRIAFVDEDGSIRAVNPDGRSREELVRRPEGESLGSLAWSREGGWLAYLASRGPTDATLRRTGHPGDLWASREACVGHVDAAARHVLIWSLPTCSNSLAADGSLLTAVPAGGGEGLPLVMMLSSRGLRDAAPDGRLALTVGAGRSTWNGKRIVAADLDAGTLQSVSRPGFAAITPAWSPDGRQIAFSAMPETADMGGEQGRVALLQRRLYVANADGTGLRQLTWEDGVRDEAPRWSGDGQHILFTRMDAQGRTGIWVVPAGGGRARQLADLGVHEWFGYYGYTGWQAFWDYWPGN